MFDRSSIPPARPGRPLLARSVEGLRDAAARISRTRPGPGMLGIETASGLQSRRPGPERFHVQLAGYGNPYSGTEVYGTAGGKWATLPGGRAPAAVYEMNGNVSLAGNVVEVSPVGAGAWHRFSWKAKGSGGGGGTPPGTIPGCHCTPIPGVLTMTSADESCNYGMFRTGTISYQARPAAYASLYTLDPGYYGDQEWPDPISGGSLFRYYLTCQTNQFTLSRIWAVSPYGSPYQDGILYTWLLGGTQNTCSPFRLDSGTAFPGSDASCGVTIDGL